MCTGPQLRRSGSDSVHRAPSASSVTSRPPEPRKRERVAGGRSSPHPGRKRQKRPEHGRTRSLSPCRNLTAQNDACRHACERDTGSSSRERRLPPGCLGRAPQLPQRDANRGVRRRNNVAATALRPTRRPSCTNTPEPHRAPNHDLETPQSVRSRPPPRLGHLLDVRVDLLGLLPMLIGCGLFLTCALCLLLG